MNHLDLFSGIGGFALAAQWVWGEEHHIHSFIEIEPFCQQVLKKHWPDAPIHEDIKTYEHDGTTIDLLTGGFPCQPYSEAGQRRGEEDDRALWPVMLRIIKESRPAWVIGENVDNFRNMGLRQSLFDLEAAGYSAIPLGIPACAVGADHARKRVWIVAHSNSERPQAGRVCRTLERKALAEWRASQKHIYSLALPSFSLGRQEASSEPGIPRVNDGIPERVDRNHALGNAIVPQVVVPIMEAIRTLTL